MVGGNSIGILPSTSSYSMYCRYPLDGIVSLYSGGDRHGIGGDFDMSSIALLQAPGPRITTEDDECGECNSILYPEGGQVSSLEITEAQIKPVT